MTDQTNTPSPTHAGPDRIDPASDDSVAHWAEAFDTTAMQVRDAVAEVGDLASDVEVYLKGTRSTTNTDRVEEAGD